jgi:hypothetical protein
MKSDRDSKRIVRSWLEEGPTVLPDRVLDAVEEILHATPQRRAGFLARWLPGRGNNRLRFGFAAAVVAVAAIFGGVGLLPGDTGGPPTPTATPTSDAITLASGSFTAQFGAATIDATGRSESTSSDATRNWIATGELEVSSEGGRFVVDLHCARVTANGLIWIGGDISESTHEEAAEGVRVAIVFEPGTPVQSVLWFEAEERAPSCDLFLEGAPSAADFLEPIQGDVQLVPAPAPTVTPTSRPGVVRDLEDFAVSVRFVLPDDWQECGSGPDERNFCPSGSTGASRGVSFLIIDNVVAHPCKRALLDPPVGPTVHELVTAIVALEGFDSTTPVDVTVDGYRGKELEVTASPRPQCQQLTWATRNRTNGVAAGERNFMRILDVAGTRLMIVAAFPGSSSEEERAEIVEVVESVRLAD